MAQPISIKKKSKKLFHEKWYYDACTLDLSETYAELINKKHPKECYVSHLALGEAYANCHLKGRDIAEAFVELIEKMRGYITITKNDGIDRLFNEVREAVPALSITDAIHVATALKNGCNVVRTLDRDVWGIDKKTLAELAAKSGMPHFSVVPMDQE